jgi:hypothetical protein
VRPHAVNAPMLLPLLLLPRLAAQLARTEEAAKRALVQTDATARGGAAQRLLDAERNIQQLRDENAELKSKLARCAACCATPSHRCASPRHASTRQLWK